MANYYVIRIREKVADYVNQNRVAVGWSKVDFSNYKDEESLFKQVTNTYYFEERSDISTQTIGKKRAEIKKIFNVKKDDIILVPCYRGFYIGKATGQMIYDTKSYDDDLSNQLLVDFIIGEDNLPRIFQRNGKNTALVTKLGVRGFTILSIYTPEIINEIDDLLKNKKDVSHSSKVARLENQMLEEFKKEISAVVSDYSQISLKAGGNGFEELVQVLFENDGYTTKKLPKNNGGSDKADADILAIRESKLGDEFASVLYIQAKHYSGKSNNGIDQIIDFKNKIEEDKIENIDPIIVGRKNIIKYALISSGEFTEYVYEMAEKNGIILIDGNRLAEMLFDIIDSIPEVRYQLGFAKIYQHENKIKL